jgi:hypothetical protein
MGPKGVVREGSNYVGKEGWNSMQNRRNHTQSVTTVITSAPSIVVRIHCNELALSQAEVAAFATVSGVGELELAANLPAVGEPELRQKVSYRNYALNGPPTQNSTERWTQPRSFVMS